ncbi:MAG: DUF115 domain-containing protein [Spirochaetaceae bacterium]|jgi:hypothetical protein|nr:DUF115 domain-containing protein [Spirochaetaceae bacterium]
MQASENRDTERPCFEKAKRGFSVFYRGKTLLSRIDPVRQAERAVEAALPLSGRTLYLLPSPLFGYGIPLIIENLPLDSSLLCIEADAALADFSSEYISSLKISRPDAMRFIQTKSPSAVAGFVRKTWGQRRFRRVEILRLTGGWQLNAEVYEAEAAMLRKLIATEWSNAMTLSKLGRLYIRNAIRNLILLASRADAEKLFFGNRPALVLGAGPSLDDFLNNVKQRPPPEACVIICADTALRPLREHGVKPNLVVTLESQHWNLRDFKGMGDWRVPIAMDLSALPAVNEFLGGETYLFWTRWTELSLFERLSALKLLPVELPPLGSVGLSALSLALLLGTGPVFTAGIDFSFTLDKYHCRGSPSHSEALAGHTRFGGLYPASALRARRVCGALRSDPPMKNYRDLFEAEFAGCGRVFAIGGGLPLGVEALSYEAALSAMRVAAGGGSISDDIPHPSTGGDRYPAKVESIYSFIENEQKMLHELLSILKGEAGTERLDFLLNAASYLWAHFPDCAGAGGSRPSSSDISFLKRVRVEIEPFIKTWESARRALVESAASSS